MGKYIRFHSSKKSGRQLNRILVRFQKNLSRLLRQHVSFANKCTAQDLGISNEQQIRTYVALAFGSIPSIDIIQEASTRRNTGKLKRGKRSVRNGRVDLLIRKYANGANMVIACELKHHWIRMKDADNFLIRSEGIRQHKRAIKQVSRIHAADSVLRLDKNTKVYRIALTAMPVCYRPGEDKKYRTFSKRSLLKQLEGAIKLGPDCQASIITFKRNRFDWGDVIEAYPGMLLLATRA